MESTGILLGLASSRSKPRNETHSPCERFARLHRRFGDEGDRHPSFQSPRVVVFLDAGHTEKPVGSWSESLVADANLRMAKSLLSEICQNVKDTN